MHVVLSVPSVAQVSKGPAATLNTMARRPSLKRMMKHPRPRYAVTRGIAQVEADAEAVLPGGAPFEYADPIRESGVTLLNRAVRPLTGLP